MIEVLTMYKEFLQGTDRVIVTYFPPHIAVSKEVLEVNQYFKLQGMPFLATGLPITPTAQLQIKVNNGGAIYWLADANEQGLREGILDKLIPGLDAEGNDG